MKKIILFFGVFLIFSISIFAQNLTLSNSSGAILSGDTVIISGGVSGTIFCLVGVANNSSEQMAVKCRRSQLSVVPGSTNQICWGGQCADQDSPPDPTYISAGDTSNEFSGDYKANGNAGTSIIQYKFFNMDSVAEQITFYCKYIATPVGIEESADISNISSAFPNPSDKTTFINYRLSENDKQARVIVSDMVGNEVKIIPVEGKDGKVRIDTYDMSDGIYFYSFVLYNKVYYTKKLVVAHL